MSGGAVTWPRVKLGEVLRHIARPVAVEVGGTYREIGIRSHGKGLFHKAPGTGAAIGDKRVFYVEPGDFILNIVFAWEGAVGLVSEAERGMIASHRFPTFRAVEGRIDLRFLECFFHTPAGLALLGRVSPGGAGRNRTLNRTAFLQQEVALPPLPEQQRIVARIDEITASLDEALALRELADQFTEMIFGRVASDLVDSSDWQRCTLGSVLVESPRNGLAPKVNVGQGGTRMLRINAVSSAENRHVDFDAARFVQVSDVEAEPYVVRDGDVFIVRYNGDLDRVAKAAVARNVPDGSPVYPDKLIRLRANRRLVDCDFLAVALGVASVREQIATLGRTTAGNIGINGAQVRSFVVPVPPLPEQHRIVAELDALQAEVDALKHAQAETRTELDALLPAILDRAFAGAL